MMELNRTEEWIFEHSIRIFLALAVAIIVATGVFVYLLAQQSQTQAQIKVLEPQVTKTYKIANICNAEALRDKLASHDCATRLRIGLVNCRRHPKCRMAFLNAGKPLPQKEVVPQQPSKTVQQPKPGRKPGAGTPSDNSASPAPPASQPPAEAPQPGNSGRGASGEHGLAVCVDLVVSACANAGHLP